MIQVVRVSEDFVARSWSFFWIKRIIIGKRFHQLPQHVRNAVYFHEMGHVELHHVEKGLFCLLTRPWKFFELVRNQELEADQYAASRGFADEMIEFLHYDCDGNSFYPSHSERRQQLKKQEKTPRRSR